MIRSEKGGAVVLLLGFLALVAISAAVYYFSFSKTTNNDASLSTTKAPSEIQNDNDGQAADNAMNSASSTNLNDTEPTADDFGL